MFYQFMRINNQFQKGSRYVRNEIKKIFCTKEGKIARALNKTATYRDPLLAGNREPLEGYFPAASSEDLKLLLSAAPEDILKKCTYTNPKDLKDYHILLKQRNNNGTLTVRILDSDGAFVKEGKIKPKKVIVLDDFRHKTTGMTYNEKQKIPHGEVVKHLIIRSNPFNDYEFIDVSKSSKTISAASMLKKILERIEAGEKIDAISCSFAKEFTYENLEDMMGITLKNKSMVEQKKLLQQTIEQYKELKDMKKEFELFEKLKAKGVKIFFGSGNGTKTINGEFTETLNYNLITNATEGVGALNHEGKIAHYSSSRKSIFTPHYESGNLCIEYRDGGFNISGGAGIDIPYTKTVASLYKRIKKLDPNSPKIKETDGVNFYQGIPLKINTMFNEVTPETIIRNGTSWATPRRTAEYTKYLMLKDII